MGDPNFTWDARIYSLRHFMEDFRHQLPALIEVHCGYHGLDDMHTYSSDEMFFVHGVKSQKRVVCMDRMNRQFSIPYSYQVPFHVVDKNMPSGNRLSKARPLRDIIDGWDKDTGLKIVMDDSKGHSFCINNDLDNCTSFDELEVIDEYDECYLIANAVYEGEMYLDSTLIPVYVAIQLTVATGLDKNEDKAKDQPQTWKAFLNHYSSLVSKCETPNLQFNKEIVELPPDLDPEDDVYDYIQPKHIIYLNQAQLRKNLEEVEGKAPPPVPEKTYKKDSKSKEGSTGSAESVDHPKLPHTKNTVSFPSLKKITGAIRKAGDKVSSLKRDTVKARTEVRKLSSALDQHVVEDSGSENDDVYDYIEIDENLKKSPQPQPGNDQQIRARKKTPLIESLEVAISTRAKRNAYEKQEIHPAPKPEISPKPKGPLSTIKEPHSVHKAPIKPGTTKQPILAPRVNRPDPKNTKDEESDDEEDIYGSLAKIPADVSSLTVSCVADILYKLGMQAHVETFIEHQVDGTLLATLDEDILLEDFNFSRFEARKLFKFVSGWRPAK